MALLALQLIFILLDNSSWLQNFKDGSLTDAVSNHKIFTEWFSPYEMPHLNFFTAFFAIVLLPSVITGAIKDISSRKQTNNHTS
ncbi:hypothetical protein F8155_24385 [Priestia endophytica]|nr:hypothetical protein F8155_24385 [Priestia endophytica]